MKKLFLFAAAAAMFAACSETEVLDQNANQQAIENQGGVKFDVYTQRGITRGGGQTGDLNNANIGPNGFGVFAFYTAGKQYSTSATPNFMYNQQVTAVTSEAQPATYGTIWKYEPVKYWPNEYGDAAISDEVDYVTFFAYAPWTKIEPTTGDIDVTGMSEVQKDSAQNYNIISVNKNTDTGDPIVKYIVDTNPATSVDLLWGIAAENAVENYTPINGKQGSTQQNEDQVVKPGMPFIDLVKPNDPVKDKLVFNLKHALAKVRITIDYIADQKTPKEGTYPTGTAIDDKYEGALDPANVYTDTINADETRIWVRQFSIEGWTNKGALNLNNAEPGLPLWKDFDGVKELVFGKMIYQDGLKDGAEGQGKIDKGESLKGLNPCLLEDATVNTADTDGKIRKFSRTNPGVGAMTLADGKLDIKKEVKLVEGAASVQKNASGANLNANGAVGTTLLFGGDPEENNGYFYVIPRNSEDGVNVTITYDVETIDPALANIFSDKVTKGSSIENVITKENIFGEGIDFQPGYQYDIHLHLGMTSVKLEATVTPWVENGETIVNLPNNQDPFAATPQVAFPEEGTTYNYVSYFGKDATLAADKGTVETTGNFVGDYVEVKVAVSEVPEYVNNIFYVPVTANTEGTERVQLLKKDGDVLKLTGIWVTITEEAIDATLLTQVLEAAAAFQYDPAYDRKGTIAISGSTIDYTITPAALASNENAIMYDIARLLGGLKRQTVAEITKIEYDGKAYQWDPNGPNTGSNWATGIPCAQPNSLVTALVHPEPTQEQLLAGITYNLKINNTPVTFNVKVQ